MQDLIASILGGKYLPPDASGPGGRPAAYAVAEWQANNCTTLTGAVTCRDYLTGWPGGPQGHMLPVARVAVILDLTRQAVQQQIARGHLLAVKVGKTFLVPLGEVERWRPVKAGRPRAEGKGVLPAVTGTGAAHQNPAPTGKCERDMKK